MTAVALVQTSRSLPPRSQTPFGNALPETPFRVRFPSYRMYNIDSQYIIIGPTIGYYYREGFR